MAITATELNTFKTSGHFIVDNFLPKTEFEQILNFFNTTLEEKKFRPAKIGKESTQNLDQTIRGDEIFWLDPKDPVVYLNSFYEKLNAIKDKLNQEFYLGLKDVESQFAIYPEGSFYKIHLDQFNADSSRQLSYVYYLNINWNERAGGELILYSNDNTELKRIEPIANRLIIFLSREFPHEVKIANQPRKSIVGWFHNKILI
jgi:SM-20-related protein